jgi:4'-phosphopantetheinyl transferase
MAVWIFAAEGQDGRRLAPALLLYGLREAFGIHSLPRMERTAEGKPYFPDRPEICFNYSHSGGLALCGISDVPLGADIERYRPVRPGLARRILSDREYGDWMNCLDQEGRFFSLWTLKESYYKCTGTGIKLPFAAVEFSFAPNGQPSRHPPGFVFRSFAGERWRAALCVREGEKSLPDILWISPKDL